jgi:hypothetical protein
MRKYISLAVAALVIGSSAGQAYAKRVARAKPVNTHASAEQGRFRLVRGKLQPIELSDALIGGGVSGAVGGICPGGARE